MNEYEKILEQLTQIFTGPEYQKEVLGAKREFFERAGIVDEENVSFEMRMSQFLDWYIFSRELSHAHMPPANYFYLKNQDHIPEEHKEIYENLTRTHHSLFEFIKLKGADVVVRDLFSKKKMVIEDSSITAGFNREEIFEARLIPRAKTWVFTKGFCFHPLEATKFIEKEIKQVRHLDQSHREAIMLKLLKMRYKFEQYKHIRLEYIYSNDGKLRI